MVVFTEAWGRVTDLLRTRKRSYQLTFNSIHGQEVLKDLITFCRANETCVVPGDRDRSLVLEGRREAWLRIQEHLNLSISDLATLYTGGNLKVENDDG